jgi:hypothetical protein
VVIEPPAGTSVPTPSTDVTGAGTVKVSDLSESSNAMAMMLASTLISGGQLQQAPDGSYALTPDLVQAFIDSMPPNPDSEQTTLLASAKALQQEMKGRSVIITTQDINS